jgi:hypothetical protein
MANASISSTSGPQPIKGFARFFRGYALSLSLIVASVPVVGGYFDLFPFFASTKAIVTGLTSVGSYLIVAFIFFQRLSLAALYFPLRKVGDRRVAYSRELRRIRLFSWAPGILTLAALLMFVLYVLLVGFAVKSVAYEYAILDNGDSVVETPTPPTYTRMHARVPLIPDATVTVVLDKTREGQRWWDVQFPNQETVRAVRAATPDVAQPLLTLSSMSFLLAFCFAVSAFVLMGLRDYLQAQFGIPDAELLSVVVAERERFYIEKLPGIYGNIEYSSDAPDLPPLIAGPFCIWHDLPPEPADINPASGEVRSWSHKRPGQKPEQIACKLEVVTRLGDFDGLFKAAAEEVIISTKRRVASRAVQHGI